MPLKPNDTVLIISPAGRVLDNNIDNAVEILESWGLKVIIAANAKGEHHNFSGTKEERLADLQWALDHPEAKAIFASRGGYGAIHLLQDLDWSAFSNNPKLLIGYSDICNLHASINNLGVDSVHGLMPNSFPHNKEESLSLETLKKALLEECYSIEYVAKAKQKEVEIEGEIVGGNLSILYSLQGTPYAPEYKGKILFIEDLCEYIYHADRMLNSLELAGVFKEIKGLIVGDFSDMKDNERPFGESLEEIIEKIATRNNVPTIWGLQTGHDTPTIALPLGKQCKVNATRKTVSISYNK